MSHFGKVGLRFNLASTSFINLFESLMPFA